MAANAGSKGLNAPGKNTLTQKPADKGKNKPTNDAPKAAAAPGAKTGINSKADVRNSDKNKGNAQSNGNKAKTNNNPANVRNQGKNSPGVKPGLRFGSQTLNKPSNTHNISQNNGTPTPIDVRQSDVFQGKNTNVPQEPMRETPASDNMGNDNG